MGTAQPVEALPQLLAAEAVLKTMLRDGWLSSAYWIGTVTCSTLQGRWGLPQ